MKTRILLVLAIGALAVATVQTSTTTVDAQSIPSRLPPPEPIEGCATRVLASAARDLIGPHPTPTPLPTPDPGSCTGRVCDALYAVTVANAAAAAAEVEWQKWQALDAATTACGL